MSRDHHGRHTLSEFCQEAPARFSERARDYSIGRPSYPEEVLAQIISSLPIELPRIAIDIGAGTGSLTRVLLMNGFEVTAVEPSEEMRQECDAICAGYENYASRAGTAESIPAENQSASLITAAQSFHWFNPRQARAECQRVLHPQGKVAILWNNRDKKDPLQQRLTSLFSTYGGERFEAQRVGLEREEDVSTFFGKPVSRSVFDYEQCLTEEAFVALGRSRSYMPKPGTELDRTAIEDLRALHRQFSDGGLAAIRYQTHLYLDTLD